MIKWFAVLTTEHLQGMRLDFTIWQISIKVLTEIVCLLSLALLITVVLWLHFPVSRGKRAGFNACLLLQGSFLHFNVSLAESVQHFLSIDSSFCQFRLLNCISIVPWWFQAHTIRFPRWIIVIIIFWRWKRFRLYHYFHWGSRIFLGSVYREGRSRVMWNRRIDVTTWFRGLDLCAAEFKVLDWLYFLFREILIHLWLILCLNLPLKLILLPSLLFHWINQSICKSCSRNMLTIYWWSCIITAVTSN